MTLRSIAKMLELFDTAHDSERQKGLITRALTVALFLSFTVSSVHAGTYRAFIPALDRTGGVLVSLLNSQDDMENTNPILIQLGVQLTRLGIQFIMSGPTSVQEHAIAEMGAQGGNTSLVTSIPVDWFNAGYARDYGLVFLKNESQGKWVGFDLEFGAKSRAVTDWLSRLLKFEVIERQPTNALSLAGGNILQDMSGRCYYAGESASPIITQFLNCTKIVNIPCLSRVCHIDEYLLFLDSTTVATNKPALADTLRAQGYKQIVLVPDADEYSLVNALVIGKHIFLLSLTQHADEFRVAADTYRQYGYDVHGIETSSFHGGGIHCMTKELPAELF